MPKDPSDLRPSRIEGSPLAFKGSGPGLWRHVLPAEQADLGEGAITASPKRSDYSSVMYMTKKRASVRRWRVP
jgi:hypothetical protein